MASGGLRGHGPVLAGRAKALAERLMDDAGEARSIADETGDALALVLAGRMCKAAGSAFNLAGAILHGRVPMPGEAPRKPVVEPMGTPGPRAGEPIAELVEATFSDDDIACFGGDLMTIVVRSGRPGLMVPRLVIRADSWDGLVDVARREVPDLPREVQILGRPEPMALETLFGLGMIEFRKPGDSGFEDPDEDPEASGVASTDPEGPESGDGAAEVLPMVPAESGPDDDGPIAAGSGEDPPSEPPTPIAIAACESCSTPIFAGDLYATDANGVPLCEKCGVAFERSRASVDMEPPAPAEETPAKKKSRRSWDLVRHIPGSSFKDAWLARVWVETVEEAHRFVELAPFPDRETIAVRKANPRWSQHVANDGRPRVIKVGGGPWKVATRLRLDDEEPAREDIPPAPGSAAPAPTTADAPAKLDPYDVTYRGQNGVTFVGRIMAGSSPSARSLFGLLVGYDGVANKGSLFAAIAWPSSPYDRIVADLGGLRTVWAEDLGTFEACFAPACEAIFGFDVADAYQGIARREPADAPPAVEAPDPEELPPDPRAGLFDVFFRVDDHKKPRFVGRIASTGDEEDAEIAFMELINYAGSAPGLFSAFPALSENDPAVESSGGMVETTAEWDTGTRTFTACVPPDALALFRIVDAESPESPPDPADLAEQAERSRAVREDLAIDPEPTAPPALAEFDIWHRRPRQSAKLAGRIEGNSPETAAANFARHVGWAEGEGTLEATPAEKEWDRDIARWQGMVPLGESPIGLPVRGCINPEYDWKPAPVPAEEPPAPADGLGIRPGDFVRSSLGPEVFRVESRAKVDKVECPVHGKKCPSGREVWNLVATQVEPTPKRGPGMAKDATRRFEGFYHDGARVRVAHSPCEKGVDSNPLTLSVVDPPAAPGPEAPARPDPIRAELPARDFDVSFYPKVGRETWLARVAAQTPQGARAIVLQLLEPPAGSPALLAYPAERRWDAKVQALGGMAAVAVDSGEPTERVIRLRVDLAVAEQHGLTVPDPDEPEAEDDPTAPRLPEFHSWWDVTIQDRPAGEATWLGRFPGVMAPDAIGLAGKLIGTPAGRVPFFVEHRREDWDAEVTRAGGILDRECEGKIIPCAIRADAEHLARAAAPALEKGYRWWDISVRDAGDPTQLSGWLARLPARSEATAAGRACEAIHSLPVGLEYHAEPARGLNDPLVARAGGIRDHEEGPGFPCAVHGDAEEIIRTAFDRAKQREREARAKQEEPAESAGAARRSAEAPTAPSEQYVDNVIAEALHRPDGASDRWQMRRASGQSGRDLRAAIAFELYESPTPPDAPHSVSGGKGHLLFTVRATDGPVPTKPVELEIHALAVRARKVLDIPTRGEPDPAEVWAVRAGTTDSIRYAIDAPTAEDAAELMDPGDVGDPRVKFGRVKTAKVPEWVEIRRMPKASPIPAPGPAPAPVAEDVQGDVPMPTADPAPAKAPAKTRDVDRALQVLFMSLGGEVTSMMGEGDGGDDEALAAAIASDLDPPGSRAKPFPTCWRGGASPGFWFGQAEPEGRATLSGKELVKRVRQVLEIPYADGTLPPPKRLGRKPREAAV